MCRWHAVVRCRVGVWVRGGGRLTPSPPPPPPPRVRAQCIVQTDNTDGHMTKVGVGGRQVGFGVTSTPPPRPGNNMITWKFDMANPPQLHLPLLDPHPHPHPQTNPAFAPVRDMYASQDRKLMGRGGL